MNTKLLATCAAGAALALATPAMANPTTATGTVAVDAVLTAACYIGDGHIDFGSHASITDKVAADGAADFGTPDSGNIDYACSNGTSPTLAISSDNASTDTWQMMSGTDALAYNISFAPDLSTLISPVDASGITLTGDGSQKTLKIYGQIPATAEAKVGTYHDDLTLTVSY
jgi:spore coat protein U-like protein